MDGILYGWILIMVTLNPDGTLEGQGKAYTCIDDYVNLNHEES